MNDVKITDYYESKVTTSKYSFNIFHVSAKKDPDTTFINFLQEQILFAYRPLSFYQYHFDSSATDDEIISYVKKIIPKDDIQLDRNVRQGDWGEVLASLIITYFQNLKVPIYSMIIN
jgi:hypothetical protein